MCLFCVMYVVLVSLLLFFFFKQKTAYEMRISDWSSDVCSSDLLYRSILEQRRVRRALTRHSLGSLLEPTGLPRAEPDQCRAVAAAFARASRYRDAPDQWLVRCLALRAMLARAGAGVCLFLGVLLPFDAPCWFLSGPVVFV